MKLKSLFALCFSFATIIASAQKKTVTGTIISSDNNAPLSKVSITVKGSQKGSFSDDEGKFSIDANESDTLIFSYIGYKTQEIRFFDQTFLTVRMESQNSQINDVVVTALGIKRDVRSLGYVSQQVGSDLIGKSQQTNFVNALQGKVAGVTINSTGGGPGQGSSIIIRGINSLDPTKNNQPLFVIDGIPIDNSTSTLGTTGGRSVQMANRFSDISPNDIENINILRGGAATALYGLRGANGVVVITTKAAKSGRFTVDFNSSYSIDEGDKFPDVQSVYTQGFMGVFDSTTIYSGWGPKASDVHKLIPSQPAKLFNNYAHAYKTGNTFKTGLTMSGGTDRASFTSAINVSNQNGILPFSYYKDVSGRVGGRLKFSEKLDAGADILFTNTDGNFYDADRFNETMTYWAPNHDVRNYLNPDGTENQYGNGNAWYRAATNKFKSDVNHVIASAYFNYKPWKWATLTYRFGVDHYDDNRKATAPGPIGIPGEIIDADNGYGFVGQYNIDYTQLNSNLLLTAEHKWTSKFNTTFRIGNDILDRKTVESGVYGDTLDVYNLFNLANAHKLSSINPADGSNLNNYERYRIIGVYGEISANYDDYLYLTLTGRNDWTSTLLSDYRSFFYPSASLSYIFSQNIKLPSWFNYGKARISYAGIGKDAAPYQTTSRSYIPTGNPINGVIQWTQNNAAGVPYLKAEKTNTLEAGTDLNFFQSRIGFHFTWYKSTSDNQIIPVSVAPSSGLTSITLNAGKIQNRGLEFTLNVTPVKSQKFNWDIDFNASHNTNKILELYNGLDEIEVGSQYGYSNASVTMKYTPGGSAGDIYGTPITRYYGNDQQDPNHTDKSRPVLIDTSGFPVLTPSTDQRLLGNSYPKWVLGWGNTFTYKNFSLYVLFDAQLNVQKYNQVENFMSAFGTSAKTLDRNDMTVFKGVLADGTPNTKQVWLGQGVGPDGKDYGIGYYRNVYRGISENFVQDAGFIKLRTLSFSYSLPDKLLKNSFIRNLKIAFTGNNLWLHTKYTGFDPETSSAVAGSNANGFSGFAYPALRSFIFSLNANF